MKSLISYTKSRKEHDVAIQGNYLVVLGKGVKGRIMDGKLQVFGQRGLERVLPFASFDDTAPAPVEEENKFEDVLRRMGCLRANLDLKKEEAIHGYIEDILIVIYKEPKSHTLEEILPVKFEGTKMWLVEKNLTEEEMKSFLQEIWVLKDKLDASYEYNKKEGLHLPKEN